MVLTSLIATLATAAFGIYHFNRLTGYGVVANMLAVPITGFWVMPLLILALLLMPFGLESLALEPAGWGIEAILWTARTVSGWPGAVSVVRAMPLLGIALVSLGGLWLCLWRRRWRFAGLAVIAAGFATVLFVRPPDLLIAEDGRLVAVTEADGSLRLSSRRADRFAGQEWLRRAGQDKISGLGNGAKEEFEAPRTAAGSPMADCRYRLEDRVVAIVRRPTASPRPAPNPISWSRWFPQMGLAGAGDRPGEPGPRRRLCGLAGPQRRPAAVGACPAGRPALDSGERGGSGGATVVADQ